MVPASRQAAVEGHLVPTEASLARAEGRPYEPASELLERILVERQRKQDEEQAASGRKKKYRPPVEPDTEDLPVLPEGWNWARFDALCEGVTVGHVGSMKDGYERRLSVLDVAEAAVERNLKRCGSLRQSILKQAFEGKLVPQDRDDEPAAELLARIRSDAA